MLFNILTSQLKTFKKIPAKSTSTSRITLKKTHYQFSEENSNLFSCNIVETGYYDIS